MALKTKTHPHEILIRLAPDGSIRGMHIRDVELVVDGSDVISERELPARALGANEFASVIGDAAVPNAKRIAELEAELASERELRAAAEEGHRQAKIETGRARSEIAAERTAEVEARRERRRNAQQENAQ